MLITSLEIEIFRITFRSFLAFFTLATALGDEDLIMSSFWCENPSLADQAGVTDQCQAYNSSAFGKKLKVTVLYESLCPGCQHLIKTVIYPQVWKLGRDFIDLELVPYGNADHKPGPNGTYDISCQHGANECKVNKLHSCVIHQLVDTSRWFPFIYCMEDEMSQQVDPDTATKKCYAQLGIKESEQKKITECTQGPQGDQLQKAAADRTDAVKPEKHVFVPWIMINDVSLQKAQIYQDILFSALCNWYRAEKTPDACDDFAKAARQKKSYRG